MSTSNKSPACSTFTVSNVVYVSPWLNGPGLFLNVPYVITKARRLHVVCMLCLLQEKTTVWHILQFKVLSNSDCPAPCLKSPIYYFFLSFTFVK